MDAAATQNGTRDVGHGTWDVALAAEAAAALAQLAGGRFGGVGWMLGMDWLLWGSSPGGK